MIISTEYYHKYQFIFPLCLIQVEK